MSVLRLGPGGLECATGRRRTEHSELDVTLPRWAASRLHTVGDPRK